MVESRAILLVYEARCGGWRACCFASGVGGEVVRRIMTVRRGIYIMYVREEFSGFGVEVFEWFPHE